uniref:Uncharacterized protein n=1 Tax=Hyaloperonospora arabidopsidis (strain Emoy2) TaxID=559515 RepID=M4BTN2_HYAAE
MVLTLPCGEFTTKKHVTVSMEISKKQKRVATFSRGTAILDKTGDCKYATTTESSKVPRRVSLTYAGFSTGCLCTVAPSQTLFVQWCVWAHLSTFVSPSRPEEQEVDYEVMARDYVKMSRWDYRSVDRAPSQASSVP